MLRSAFLKTTFFLILLLSEQACYANDVEDEADAPQAHAFTVQLEESVIAATGLQTQVLYSRPFRPELETFATRVDLSPLLESRKDYFAALAKQTTAQIAFKQSQVILQRLENLQREKAVSTRKLLAQKSQLEIDLAHLKSAQNLSDNIKLHTQSRWGKVLSQWFLTEQSPPRNMLNALSKSVYLIFLPASDVSPLPEISVHPFGLREKALTASYLSSAPVSETYQQTGTPYFYLSDQAFDAYHQRVVAWLPILEKELSGFVIPASALVWHLGLAYVYLQVNEELFKRVKVPQKQLTGSDAYFIQHPLQEGDVLVTVGGQMLLSEEFRGQIPAEDDDDDD